MQEAQEKAIDNNTKTGSDTGERCDFSFVIWRGEGYGFRLDQFAATFGTTILHSFKPRWLGIKTPLPIRYLLQGIETYGRWRKMRPKAIVVQTPPFLLTLTAWIYCKFNRAFFITDNHSSTFAPGKWQKFNSVDKILFRSSLINIGHNHKNIEQLEKWGANRPMLVRSPATRREEILDESVKLPDEIQGKLEVDRLKVLYVNRFSPVNCYMEIFEAARLMPEAQFIVTGNPEVVNLDLDAVPENVVLTGYIPREEFIVLMDQIDVVLSLTKLKDALAYTYRDCIALRKPFVGTNNEVAVANFGEYGVFSNIVPEEIAAKTKEVFERKDEFIPKMAGYIEEDKKRWVRDMDEIKRIVDEAYEADTRGELK